MRGDFFYRDSVPTGLKGGIAGTAKNLHIQLPLLVSKCPICAWVCVSPEGDNFREAINRY